VLPCSDAEQYKYGKNRVEADAKRLQSKEEELLKRKEALRNRLAQLRKERKDLRAAIEVNAGMGDLALMAHVPVPAGVLDSIQLTLSSMGQGCLFSLASWGVSLVGGAQGSTGLIQ
jgi:predicted ribosome quality control (RQC) complex YloA/Tae2 family protein